MTDDSSPSRATLIVVAAALVRFVFAALIPAFPDETYYWDWSRHLAAGYFDHPPVVAWLVRLGEVLLSPFGASVTAFALRFSAVAASCVAAFATVALARRIAGEAAAVRAAILLSVMPLAAAGLILATPDSPLLAAAAVGLYCVVRALQSSVGSQSSLRWWVLTGVALGAAFCSKYTSIFLPVGVLLAVVARPALRARLREPGPYVACVIATLIFLPVLLWNARHDWISFVYQVRHGLSAAQGSALRAAWRHEGDFFGGQAALASPILFVMLAIATGRALRGAERWNGGTVEGVSHTSDQRYVLAVVATLSFAFFIYSALRQRVEPNWPAPAYIPAIVLLATASWSRTSERWLAAGTVFAAVMSVLIYAQGVRPILPIAPPKDPIARAHGWRAVTVQAESLASVATRETNATTWLGGDRYQEASELAFHASSHPRTFATNIAGRPNQYDLWPRFADVAKAGDNLVLVLDDGDDHTAIKTLSPSFAEVRAGPRVELKRGAGVIGVRKLWLLKEYRR